MKAVSRIQAKIGGVSFDIPAGREVPPELARHLTENGGSSLMKDDTPPVPPTNGTKGKKD